MLDGDRAAPFVTAAASDENRLDETLFQRIFDGFKIEKRRKSVVFQGDRVKIYAELLERAAIFTRYDVFERVVRFAGHRNKDIARTKHAEQHERQRLCAGGDHGRNDGTLGAERVRKHLRQRISAGVVVAVSRASREMPRLNGVFAESAEHLFLIEKRNVVNTAKFRREFVYTFVYKPFGALSVHFTLQVFYIFAVFIIV